MIRVSVTPPQIVSQRCTTMHSNISNELYVTPPYYLTFAALNPFLPTVPTFAVRETDVSQHNGGTSGAPPPGV